MIIAGPMMQTNFSQGVAAFLWSIFIFATCFLLKIEVSIMHWKMANFGAATFYLACSLIIFTAVRLSSAHVVLTFPTPRVFASDFFTNGASLAQGPCGTPRGLNNPMSMLSGIQYNVTWENDALHPGGWRIELLSHNYSLIQTLFPMASDNSSTNSVVNVTTTTADNTTASTTNMTDGNQTASSSSNSSSSSTEWGASSDPTLTWKMVVLPSMDCDGCIIRLVKQTGNSNPAQAGDVVRSCADVNIRKKVTRREYCSSHGTYSLDDQQCQCDRQFDGQNCQFQDECITVRDCNYNGACYPTESMSYPHRQCYCAPGFFGNQCEYRSAINVTNVNISDYQSEQLSDDVTLAWQMIGQDNDTLDDGQEAEIEFVLQVQNSTSWIALGLRSPNATTDCRNFPMRPPLETNIPQNNTAAVDTVGGMADAAANMTGSALPGSLHPMECLDVVWAAAKGNMGRVRDMDTPSLQKPYADEYYGGRMTLTAAMAFEDGNTTTLMFRRRLLSAHPTDAQINKGDMMHVAFSRGQDPDSSSAQLNGFAAAASVSNPNFYPRDELKYHGYGANQRGAKEIVLV